MKKIHRAARGLLVMLAAMSLLALAAGKAQAATAQEIDQEVDKALQTLFEKSPQAKQLAKMAKGILVFPKIYKAGFIVGGQYGEGALRIHGTTVAYFKSIGASYGLQAGVQSFGYALFFMTYDSLKYLFNSKGWEIGVGPSIVVVDAGAASSFTTTTAKDDIYAFFFNQKGLMAGLGLQGTKITPFEPEGAE
jgi:lipid-binding SYLF domain-containing protein